MDPVSASMAALSALGKLVGLFGGTGDGARIAANENAAAANRMPHTPSTLPPMVGPPPNPFAMSNGLGNEEEP